TSIGRMLVQLLGVFAEFERATIVDRVINGMTTKASKGKWPGGTRPYGYQVHPDTQQLVPHPQEAPTLREIFHLYTRDRLGTRAIAAQLNHRGVRNRTGKPWSGYTVARIHDNPAYTGDIAYREVYVSDAHPPLIDRDTFDRARQIATARHDAHTQRAMTQSDYHLTGLITCPDCGHKVHRHLRQRPHSHLPVLHPLHPLPLRRPRLRPPPPTRRRHRPGRPQRAPRLLHRRPHPARRRHRPRPSPPRRNPR